MRALFFIMIATTTVFCSTDAKAGMAQELFAFAQGATKALLRYDEVNAFIFPARHTSQLSRFARNSIDYTSKDLGRVRGVSLAENFKNAHFTDFDRGSYPVVLERGPIDVPRSRFLAFNFTSQYRGSVDKVNIFYGVVRSKTYNNFLEAAGAKRADNYSLSLADIDEKLGNEIQSVLNRTRISTESDSLFRIDPHSNLTVHTQDGGDLTFKILSIETSRITAQEFESLIENLQAQIFVQR